MSRDNIAFHRHESTNSGGQCSRDSLGKLVPGT